MTSNDVCLATDQITNHVAPAYEGVELGIGGQVLGKALKAVSGTTGRDLKQLWNQHGDFGDVAFAAKSKWVLPWSTFGG